MMELTDEQKVVLEKVDVELMNNPAFMKVFERMKPFDFTYNGGERGTGVFNYTVDETGKKVTFSGSGGHQKDRYDKKEVAAYEATIELSEKGLMIVTKKDGSCVNNLPWEATNSGPEYRYDVDVDIYDQNGATIGLQALTERGYFNDIKNTVQLTEENILSRVHHYDFELEELAGKYEIKPGNLDNRNNAEVITRGVSRSMSNPALVNQYKKEYDRFGKSNWENNEEFYIISYNSEYPERLLFDVRNEDAVYDEYKYIPNRENINFHTYGEIAAAAKEEVARLDQYNGRTSQEEGPTR